MLTYKVLSAIAAMAMGAAVVMVMPGFSPQADASTAPTTAKTDRLPIRPIGRDCSQQAWPYYETTCLRDRTQAAGQARQIRILTTDRVQ